MAEAAIIEIVEHTSDPDPLVIIPNEIRINGQSILAPADDPVEVHGILVGTDDIVKVTLTLYAKRVTIGAEGPRSSTHGDPAGRANAEVAAILADHGHNLPHLPHS